jgi:hypothetical protein
VSNNIHMARLHAAGTIFHVWSARAVFADSRAATAPAGSLSVGGLRTSYLLAP